MGLDVEIVEILLHFPFNVKLLYGFSVDNFHEAFSKCKGINEFLLEVKKIWNVDVLSACIIQAGLGQLDDEVNGFIGLKFIFNSCDQESDKVDVLELLLEINQDVNIVELLW